VLVLVALLIDLFAPHFLVPLTLQFPAFLSPLAYLVKLIIATVVLAIWELMEGQLKLREPIGMSAVAAGLALASIALTFISRILI
jgi:hypothetical protein